MSDLPPVEPRDLRNRGQQRSTSSSNYPPSGSNYPPQGSNYPPGGSNYPPPQPEYPPSSGGYPPPAQPSYPPAQPDYPPQGYPPPAQPSYPPPQPSYPPPGLEEDILMPPANPGPELDSIAAPDLRRNVRPQTSRRGQKVATPNDPASPTPSRLGGTAGYSQLLLTERQVEALGWGVCFILFGVSILLLFTGASGFLINGFPLLGGSVLLLSSIYQQMHRWRVSAVTWLTAIGLVAFSITRMVAMSDGIETGIGRSVAYFLGVSIIIAGLMVLVRIFRAPRAS